VLLLKEYWSGLVGNLAVSSLVIHVPSNGVWANNVAAANSTTANSNFFMRHLSLSEIVAAQQKGSARVTRALMRWAVGWTRNYSNL
jgi:hypothetical protein